MVSPTIFTDIILLTSILLYLFLTPFTKVEESFNIQAMNDLLLYGLNLTQYDHFDFPGVVPRTFIGPIVIVIVSYLPIQLISFLQLENVYNLYICRAVLGLFMWFSFIHIRQVLTRKFSLQISIFFTLILAFQFHVPFYSTRTLPNTFAVILSNHAFAFWLNGYPTRALLIVGCAMTIFRCDLLILLGPMALWMLITQEISFFVTFFTGVSICLFSLVSTFLIDSYFWNKFLIFFYNFSSLISTHSHVIRWLWPEGIVLWFNLYENKSSEWGISPWHWYFSSAIPRALQLSLPLVLIAFTGIHTHETDKTVVKPKRLLYYLLPYLMFVSLYSYLPHKELRFIFPIFAPLSLAAAVGLNNLIPHYSSRRLSMEFCFIIQLFIGCFFVGMALISSIFAVASIYNYPGGEALSTLHTHLFHSIHHSVYGNIPLVSRQCSDLIYRPIFPSESLLVHPVSSSIHVPFFPHSTWEDTVCLQPKYQKYEFEYGLHTCDIYLHIDAASAISGITRFQEISFTDKSLYQIHYSKNESKNISYELEYDFLIRGIDNNDSREDISKSFDLLYTIYSFSGYSMNWLQLKSIQLLFSNLLPEQCEYSICQQYQDMIQEQGEHSLSIIHRPFYGPLSIKFQPTHQIYRNKRIIKYIIKSLRE